MSTDIVVDVNSRSREKGLMAFSGLKKSEGGSERDFYYTEKANGFF